MNDAREVVLTSLAESVVQMDVPSARKSAQRALAMGMDPYTAITEGLNAGMARVNALFERHEYFIPELLLCSDAMYAGLSVLKPHLSEGARGPMDHTIVIGVVAGDTHDIGKNIVASMLEAAGFTVVDLGRDVAVERFVEAASEHEDAVIALSTLMTSTMGTMADVVAALPDHRKSIVGGAPVSLDFARRIGASAYARDAAGAVSEIRMLLDVS